MIYENGNVWKAAKHKKVLLFAMSGLGKTHVSSMLRNDGDWFHYSVDYRIGTRYMGEHIVDNFKKAAMSVPFLADLLRSDSISIASNISFENLAPLSTYLGKPGDVARGGIPFDFYCKRQDQHHAAEQAALLDTPAFIERAQNLYDYQNFVCDSGGSICEVVDPWDKTDQVMTSLSENLLMVWIAGNEAHTSELVRRFDKSPKPMCYQPAFLLSSWEKYQSETGLSPDKVNPDDFIRWTYARALAHRQPRYVQMAQWGITLQTDDVKNIYSPEYFEDLVASALDAKVEQSA
ncbi:ATPase [uncultured Planktomarina sp.]|uniref:ATPase n=1 Tax=uncultured Planktomarina sp. TaxID=1538529 RepID=UPI00326028C8